MTYTATNVALAQLRAGVRFRIDGGPLRVFVSVEHNEHTAEARITYRDPDGHPAHAATVIVDPAAVEFTVDTITIPASEVRPGDRLIDGKLERIIRVGAARTFGKKARVTTIDPAPFRGDPIHIAADRLVAVERTTGQE